MGAAGALLGVRIYRCAVASKWIGYSAGKICQVTKPLLLFYSYADEDERYFKQLDRVLRPLQQRYSIVPWSKGKVLAGTEWQHQRDKNLDCADLILLLISPDYLASDLCQKEIERALKRQETGESLVIPILVRPVDYEITPCSNLPPLPRNRKPVTSWPNEDEAWNEVAIELRKAAAPSESAVVRQQPDGVSTRSREALPQHPPLDATIVELKAKVEESLRQAPALVKALAARGYGNLACNDPLGSVACALVDSPAQTLALNLAQLAGELARERESARGLLWQILPFATDWRALLIKARAAPSGSAIELPLRTETVAEIVLAGIHGRCCRFAPGGHSLPRGATYIPLPALAYGPFFDPHCQGLIDAILFNLYDEQSPDAPVAAGQDPWRGLKQRFPQFSRFKAMAKGQIKSNLEPKDAHYMLIIDDDLDPQSTRDLDCSWAIAKAALTSELPGLHLVRLKGGLPELEHEGELVPLIRKIRDLL